MTEKIEFDVIVPRQNAAVPVFTFAAKASDVQRFARIERAGRDAGGVLSGFQRPQIAAHIREIRDYLEKPSAILPNPIVIAFTRGASLKPIDGAGAGLQRLTIDLSDGAPGLIVDGQQRFTAFNEIGERDFELLVSGFVCDGQEELQRQFILINNTRPLPKALVYELLPQVSDLPLRMSNRSQAALLTEALNYRADSSLRGLIRQQTNPKGIIRDTVLQRLIMGSLTDGALRLHAGDDRTLMENGTRLISEYFHAVQTVFEKDWKGRTPKDSRLLHGAGIIAMGYVMEALHVMTGATERDQFADGLRLLRGKTAWTEGEWTFGGERRRWNGLQNVPSDIRQLSLHLVQVLKRGLAEREQAA